MTPARQHLGAEVNRMVRRVIGERGASGDAMVIRRLETLLDMVFEGPKGDRCDCEGEFYEGSWHANRCWRHERVCEISTRLVERKLKGY